MMRLPNFQYRAPRTIEDAAKWLAESPSDTMLVSGGTDLLPNMKRRQQTPRTIVGLRGISALREIRVSKEITIGAGVTLSTIVGDARVKSACPGLWQAAAQIATPHLRNMGTVGGNLCLDTRCTYYDQSEEWRRSIGYCMKKEGKTCWVATSSPRCLAVSSTDLAPMLQALGARVRLISASGERTIEVAELYRNDGMHYLMRRPDEILVDVTIPAHTGQRSAYWKLRRRGSFDFPVASAAVSAHVGPDGRVTNGRVVLGAVASRPLTSEDAGTLLKEARLTDETIAAAADAAFTIAKPMDNTDFELVWRKKMVRMLVTAALREVRGDDTRETRKKIARQIF
jgi:4-hydroxybenzoyl-CoA reductase subunit beta